MATINIRNLFISVSAFISAGCTQVGLQLANAPTHLDAVTRHQDVAYGELAQQTMDIYQPDNAEQAPVIVFFYGGRWTDGSKDMYPFVAKPFVDLGYIVAVPDYRKYPSVKFPTFVEDGAKAVAWTLDNIKNYQGDPSKVVIMGHSAGAHIGALISSNADYLAAHQHSYDEIKAFIGLSGPYDFVPDEEDLKDMFGPPEQYPNMTVTTFIEGDEPPMLLLWGAQDTLVGQRNIDLLAQQIELKRGSVETKIYPEMGHVDMVSNFIWFIPSKAPLKRNITDFIARQL